MARAMAVDVLTERGYHVTSDYKISREPTRIDLATGEIICHERMLYIFYVRFHRTQLRMEDI